jgi:MYXO-CTERM domain-containing protein
VDTDCDDGNVCTSDKCSSNKCQHASVSGCCKTDSDCDDKNPCTTDACDAKTGSCTNKAQADCCAVDTDCDDGDPCTLDRCDPSNTCQHTNICSDAGIVPADSAVPSGDGTVPVGDTGGAAWDAAAKNDGGGPTLSPVEDSRRLSGGCSMNAAGTAWPPVSLLLLGLLFLRRRNS